MKKIALITLAGTTISLAPFYAFAKENAVDLTAQEQAYDACETLANEDSSGEDWSVIFDECIKKQSPTSIEDTTWEIPTSYEDMDEADMENDAAIDY